MNLSLFLPLVVTAALAIAGWWAVHRLSMNRDQENKRRDLRVQYLLEAYRKLERSANRGDLVRDYAEELESALGDIQLLGTEHQVSLAHEFSVSKDLTMLLTDIRAELRRELKLGPLAGPPVAYRFPKDSLGSKPHQENFLGE